MPLAALLLVLGAAVCHSAWNLLVKTDARRLEIQSGALVVGVVLGRPATRANGRALGLALLTGVFTAGYSLVNKLGVGLVPVPLYAFLVFGVDATLIHVVRWVRGGLTPPLGRDAPRGRTVAVGVLMMAAYLAVLAAMTMAPVSYVVAAREVSVVVTAALGALVLREPPSAARTAGQAEVVAGLVGIP